MKLHIRNMDPRIALLLFLFRPSYLIFFLITTKLWFTFPSMARMRFNWIMRVSTTAVEINTLIIMNLSSNTRANSYCFFQVRRLPQVDPLFLLSTKTANYFFNTYWCNLNYNSVRLAKRAIILQDLNASILHQSAPTPVLLQFRYLHRH